MLTVLSVNKDTIQLEFSHICGGNTKRHSGVHLPYDPAPPLPAYLHSETTHIYIKTCMFTEALFIATQELEETQLPSNR